MESIYPLINLILHIDQHLFAFVSTYGVWTYALLFFIIFSETGFVITPFLPGDSLLFAAGAIAANSENALNIHILFLLLFFASISGNTLNYAIGRFIGPKVFYSNHSWLFNKNYLLKAHAFYEEYGGKTIILARFIPIIRTFAPFVAGIGYMRLREFLMYNIMGAFLWIGGFLYVSYWFGNLPLVKEHFSLIVIGIIIVSLLPPLIGLIRQKCRSSS